jgi:protein O-GlcNAc transferase
MSAPHPTHDTNNPVAQAQALFQSAVDSQRRGQAALALTLCEQAIELEPRHFEALRLSGLIAGRLNQPQRAAQLLARAILVNPASPQALMNHGTALCLLKDHAAAIASFDRAIALEPCNPDAHYNRGIALAALGRQQDAVASFEAAITRNAAHAAAHFNRGIALIRLDRYDDAVASLDRALVLRPHHPQAHYNRGIALGHLRRYADAVASYTAAIAQRPDFAEAYNNRGTALSALGKHEAAVESFTAAIERSPQRAEFLNNRALALLALSRYAAARADLEAAIGLNPQFAEAHSNLGMVLGALHLPQPALESLDAALRLDPARAEIHLNRANLLRELRRFEAALESFDEALASRADLPFVPGLRLHMRMQLCSWEGVDTEIAGLSAAIERGEAVSPPFPVLALTGSAALQRRAAEIWVREKHPPRAALPVIARRAGGGKIRVGYFSADFREHAVSILTAGVFEAHDRDRFELFGFSFGPGAQDPVRERLERAFDRFEDVHERSDREIAELARSFELDVAVDLTGFTLGGRPDVFALRAAPVQVSYLGYLGTLAAPYMDYLIADPTIVPEACRQHYAEKILYLPSYQANDRSRRIAERTPERAELGLPATGFVFCCFNASYKITPAVFDSWIRILRRVPDSALLLYAANATIEANLRKEALQRGLEPQRLVFAGKLPPPEYLARYRAADLFLDTLPYNAGTTASDALWAGLPVLTCAGEAFAGRVAASLLCAVGLPELIASTPGEYEDRAVELAGDPAQLAAIRQKLADHRLTTPLFDVQQFTRHLEAAYTAAFERHQAGLPADDLAQ